MLIGFDLKPKTPAPSFSSITGTGTGTDSSLSYSFKTPLSPPEEPDYSELENELSMIPGRFNPGRATASFDDSIAKTGAITGQLSENAANVYAQRLLRMGINPTAAGVVRAQTKLAGNRQVADMRLQRDQYQQQVKKEAATLSAQIAANLAQLRESYSRTLAEFNMQQASFAQRDAQFATGASQEEARLRMAEKELEIRSMLADLEKAKVEDSLEEKPTGQWNVIGGMKQDFFGNDAARRMMLSS